MAKVDELYGISYIGNSCAPLDVPSELLGSVDISNVIWMPERVIWNVIRDITGNHVEFYGEEREVSLGRVMREYHIDGARVGVSESIPAIQLRSDSTKELEGVSDQLGLPYVNGSVHRPGVERERLAKLNVGSSAS